MRERERERERDGEFTSGFGVYWNIGISPLRTRGSRSLATSFMGFMLLCGAGNVKHTVSAEKHNNLEFLVAHLSIVLPGGAYNAYPGGTGQWY
jgi:hypothetical protein